MNIQVYNTSYKPHIIYIYSVSLAGIVFFYHFGLVTLRQLKKKGHGEHHTSGLQRNGRQGLLGLNYQSPYFDTWHQNVCFQL